MKSFIRRAIPLSFLLLTTTFVLAQSGKHGRDSRPYDGRNQITGATVTLADTETGEVKTFTANSQARWK